MTSDFRIVAASSGDVPLILSLFRELAIYEKLEASFVVDEAVLNESLFGPKPSAEVRLAYAGGEPVGYMVFFHNFSTFLGKSGIYLEDLYIKPQYRGAGYGKALLAELARITIERGCKRLEWTVLDWNTPSIDFYKSLDAEPMTGWTNFRLTGKPLERLATTEAK